MKWLFVVIGLSVLILRESHSLPSGKQLNFLDEAKLENFNEDELEILKPIISVLQQHYDRLLVSKSVNNTITDGSSHLQLEDLLLPIRPELLYHEEPAFQYVVNFQTTLEVISLKGIPANERDDIEAILLEYIENALETIKALVEASNATENGLLKINKIKIIKFVYRMIQKIYGLATQSGRTAYCSYSSIPALNKTLTEGSQEIESCYNYTKKSIGQLRNDVKSAISDIRTNIKELASIYRKLANRHSLLGKLLTLMLNIQEIRTNIKETKSIAIQTVKGVKTDGPVIVAHVKECALVSIPDFVHKLNETLNDLSTCINFVDDSTQGPEPEPESYEDYSES